MDSRTVRALAGAVFCGVAFLYAGCVLDNGNPVPGANAGAGNSPRIDGVPALADRESDSAPAAVAAGVTTAGCRPKTGGGGNCTGSTVDAEGKLPALADRESESAPAATAVVATSSCKSGGAGNCPHVATVD